MPRVPPSKKWIWRLQEASKQSNFIGALDEKRLTRFAWTRTCAHDTDKAR